MLFSHLNKSVVKKSIQAEYFYITNM